MLCCRVSSCRLYQLTHTGVFRCGVLLTTASPLCFGNSQRFHEPLSADCPEAAVLTDVFLAKSEERILEARSQMPHWRRIRSAIANRSQTQSWKRRLSAPLLVEFFHPSFPLALPTQTVDFLMRDLANADARAAVQKKEADDWRSEKGPPASQGKAVAVPPKEPSADGGSSAGRASSVRRRSITSVSATATAAAPATGPAQRLAALLREHPGVRLIGGIVSSAPAPVEAEEAWVPGLSGAKALAAGKAAARWQRHVSFGTDALQEKRPGGRASVGSVGVPSQLSAGSAAARASVMLPTAPSCPNLNPGRPSGAGGVPRQRSGAAAGAQPQRSGGGGGGGGGGEASAADSSLGPWSRWAGTAAAGQLDSPRAGSGASPHHRTSVTSSAGPGRPQSILAAASHHSGPRSVDPAAGRRTSLVDSGGPPADGGGRSERQRPVNLRGGSLATAASAPLMEVSAAQRGDSSVINAAADSARDLGLPSSSSSSSVKEQPSSSGRRRLVPTQRSAGEALDSPPRPPRAPACLPLSRPGAGQSHSAGSEQMKSGRGSVTLPLLAVPTNSIAGSSAGSSLGSSGVLRLESLAQGSGDLSVASSVRALTLGLSLRSTAGLYSQPATAACRLRLICGMYWGPFKRPASSDSAGRFLPSPVGVSSAGFGSRRRSRHALWHARARTPRASAPAFGRGGCRGPGEGRRRAEELPLADSGPGGGCRRHCENTGPACAAAADAPRARRGASSRRRRCGGRWRSCSRPGCGVEASLGGRAAPRFRRPHAPGALRAYHVRRGSQSFLLTGLKVQLLDRFWRSSVPLVPLLIQGPCFCLQLAVPEDRNSHLCRLRTFPCGLFLLCFLSLFYLFFLHSLSASSP